MNNGLVMKLQQGDKLALRQWYKVAQPKLLRWVMGRVKEKADAEEIVQDTFLAFLDSLPIYQGKSSVWTYLVSIAKHEVADYWRKRYAKKAILTIPFAEQVYTEKLFSAKITAREIGKIYRQLLPAERVILVWKYEDEVPVGEIANRLEISLKAAESRLFRARKAFILAYELIQSK